MLKRKLADPNSSLWTPLVGMVGTGQRRMTAIIGLGDLREVREDARAGNGKVPRLWCRLHRSADEDLMSI